MLNRPLLMNRGDKVKKAYIIILGTLIMASASSTAYSADDTNDLCIADAVKICKDTKKFSEKKFNKTINTLTLSPPVGKYDILISEICSDNEQGITASDKKRYDWIELYNNSPFASDISGFGLSDKKNKPFKYTLPDITLESGEYVIIFADKDASPSDKELTAPFGISSKGETITLTAPDGTIVDSVDMPPMREDMSYGRYRPYEEFTVISPTPDAPNDSTIRYLNGPVFSAESGFYESPFSLKLTADPDCEIYYTTDGSIPTIESKHYTRPINIKDRSDEPNGISAERSATYPRSAMNYVPQENVAKSTVIRAIETNSSGQVSNVVTRSYFVGIDLAKQYNNTPVFSLAVDPADLFDYDTGIYTTGKYYDYFKSGGGNNGIINNDQTWLMSANFTQKCTPDDNTWEKAVHVDMFEGDGSQAFSQDMGVRIFGASSRANLQKSLKLIARKKYGNGKLNYKLIPDAIDPDGNILDKFDSFILRCGANDASWTKLRDPVLQELVRDRDFESQCGRPAIAFLNGEYWGLYQITEDYSDNYIENRYGYNKDNVIIIKNGELEDGTDNDLENYKEFVKFVRNSDMSVKENYEKLCSLVDVRSMADYHASQIFINNQDVYGDAWINNTRMWKLRNAEDESQGDGRWRWMLYDTEYSTYLYGRGGDFDALKNSFYENSDTVIFSKTLRQSKEFKELFLNTVMDLANMNYTKENTDRVIDKYYDLYSPLMEEHIKRFGPDWRVRNLYNGFYQNQIEKFKNFFEGRREKLAKAMISCGLGKGTSKLAVSVNNNDHGTVVINTISPTINSTGWEGLYFNDCELTITAVPNEGYVFDGWDGIAKGKRKTVKVRLTENSSIKANFKKK